MQTIRFLTHTVLIAALGLALLNRSRADEIAFPRAWEADIIVSDVDENVTPGEASGTSDSQQDDGLQDATPDADVDTSAIATDDVAQTDTGGESTGSTAAGTAAAKKSADANNKPTNPCATSHKPLFYLNDFSYLNDPDYNGNCLGDCWKLMPAPGCGGCGTLDVGGQMRLRYHHEIGMGQDVSGPGVLRFEDTEHDFLLSRLRLYTNWKLSDDVRFYVEGILADVTDDDDTYLPRNIDRNFGDFLNAFVDLGLTDEATLRIGRQELLYGDQRLVSPLDWANTRRTFEGIKLITKHDDWTIDGFYTHFVPVIPNRLDEADYKQPFYGAYATYAGIEKHTFDFYYLGYDNRHPGTITSDFSLHTFGSRMYVEKDEWLYDAEGGVQVGRQSGLGLDQDAGFATAGIGRKFTQHPWKPIVWVHYDYASGDAHGGDFNRFNQLFPLGHKYFGFIDAVQRSNIEAPNVLVTMYPKERLELLFWYWYFQSNTANDIVPSIGGTPPQSTNSKDFGQELDFYLKHTLSPRSNILYGWSHFWRGNKILAPKDADFFYVQWELNF